MALNQVFTYENRKLSSTRRRRVVALRRLYRKNESEPQCRHTMRVL